MKLRLLKLLICPDCKGKVAIERGVIEAEEITDGALKCSSCKRLFQVVRGVPDFSPDKLEELEAKTARCFAYEWTNFKEFDPASEKGAFLDWIKPLQESFFKDKLVLDAGCGMGRHSYLASTFGARDVVSVDLSDSVYAAMENTKKFDNVHIIKADLRKLPFGEGLFDYIFSIGVLHHLGSPEKGFEALAKVLKVGGTISVWVYGLEGNRPILYIVDPIRRLITKRLPLGFSEKLAFGLALLLWPFLKGLYLQLAGKKHFINKFLLYRDYLTWLSQWDLKKVTSIVFDHMSAPVAHYLSKETVSGWFPRGGWTDVRLSQRNGNSWRCSAIKAS